MTLPMPVAQLPAHLRPEPQDHANRLIRDFL
jgi:hypothetical protein